MFTGPNISTDRLTLYLDVANIKSYTSGSNTFYNLGDLNNNGTVTIYTASSAEYPLIINEGGNSYFDLSNNNQDIQARNSLFGFAFNSDIDIIPDTGSFTIHTWIQHISASSNVGQITILGNAGASIGFRFGTGRGGVYVLSGPPYSETHLGEDTYGDDEWVMLSGVFDRGAELSGSASVRGYINGQPVGRMNQSPQNNFSGSTYLGLFNPPCCLSFVGYFASIIVYKRPMEDQEIEDIFNSYRNRFGI